MGIVRCKNLDELEQYIDILKQLKAEGTIDGLPHLGNNFRLVGIKQQFEFHEWDSTSGLTQEQKETLFAKHNFTPWMGMFVISGAKVVAQAKAKRVKKTLGKALKVTIFSTQTVSRIKKIILLWRWLFKRYSFYQNLVNKINEISTATALMDGEPSNFALKGCYWRHRNSDIDLNKDPIQAGCGFCWISPTLPLKGKTIIEFVTLSEALFEQYGFEFAVTLTVSTAHNCQAIVGVSFDKDNPSEVDRAKLLIDSLRTVYKQKKWICYRRTIDEMPFKQDELEQDALMLRQTIKNALDPNGIIAPGRYEARYYTARNDV